MWLRASGWALGETYDKLPQQIEWAFGSGMTLQSLPEGPKVPLLCLGPLLLPSKCPLLPAPKSARGPGQDGEGKEP